MDLIEGLTRSLITEIGENPDREGLVKTPQRVSQSLRFLTKGYGEDIEFFSLCEHHLLPFFGQCHIAYIPNGKIIGLSKIPRIVDVFSRRLQVQERLTSQIAQTFQEYLNPLGVAVVMEAGHLCMMMRGVEKQHSKATTSAMLGVFREDRSTRIEFLELTQSKNK